MKSVQNRRLFAFLAPLFWTDYVLLWFSFVGIKIRPQRLKGMGQRFLLEFWLNRNILKIKYLVFNNDLSYFIP